MRHKIDAEATKEIKKYSIGDMARMLSTSPSAIRFYDQEGIVTPHRSSENQYRQYTVVDGHYLLMTKEMKNSGFSVQETRKMLNECTLTEFEEGLADAGKRLEEEIFRLSLYRTGLQKYCQRCALCREEVPLHIAQRPELYRYNHQINDVWLESEEHVAALKLWTDFLPATVLSFLFRKDELLECPEEADLYWGFSIEAEMAAGTGLDRCPLSEHIPACSAVHMVFCTKNETFLNARRLQPALDYIREHNFQVSGDVVGNSLARVLGEDGSLLHYYDVWVPIL